VVVGPGVCGHASHRCPRCLSLLFDAAATTAIYTLSLHDALPIYRRDPGRQALLGADSPVSPPGVECGEGFLGGPAGAVAGTYRRSEEHTSELQSRENLVCRLLLEKKKHSTDRRRQLRGGAGSPGQ